MANSRALERTDTLLAPRLSGGHLSRNGRAKLPRKMGHFQGGQTGLEAFVPALQSGAVNGLLQGVAGQDAKDNRITAIHLRQLQASSGFRANVVVMRCFAAQDAAN